MSRFVLTFSKAIVLVVCAFGLAFKSQAQVTVTATGVGPGPTIYASLNAAFAAINAGTHQGAITCTITANTTEPAPPTPLLASGGTSNYTSILITPQGNVTVNSAAAPTASRGIIEIQGADNVTIDGDDPGTAGTRNLTFQAAAVTTTGVAVVRFASTSTTNGATFCTIRNCIVVGSRSAATSTVTNYGIYSGTAIAGNTSTIGQSDNNDNLTIENNEVRRCYWGIYVAGTSANKCDNLVIRNNLVGNAVAADAVANRGIYLQNTQTTASSASAIVELNDIRLTGATGTTDIAAIEVANGNAGAFVRRNQLHDVQNLNTGGQGSYGLWITGATENAGIEVSNNFIWDCYNDNWTTTYSTTASDLPVGIRVSAGATGLKIYHNSVSLNQPNTDPTTINFSVCLQITVGTVTGSDIRNNILSNTQTGIATSGNYCISVPVGFAFGTINGNDYYETQTYSFVGWNGSNRSALADWQSQTLQDAGSKAVIPSFTSTTNLHIPAATASELESAGVAGTGITIDIDNDTRPGPAGSVNGGATANDIGADEFDGVPVDLTPPTISYTALSNTCAFGARTLTASITDASGVPTAGAGLPVLYWRINAGAYTAATGTHTGGSNYDFSFGAGVVATDVVSYYIAAQDNAGTPNVGAFPSAGAAGFTANPPAASTPPTTPSSYVIGITLSGTYTVGATGTYTTIAAAIAAYQANCLGGPVVFELIDPSYTEGPLTINAHAEASSTNTLTIRPAAGNSPTISATSTTAIFILNGADYVTIDGSNAPVANTCCPLLQSSRDMTITNTSTSTTSAVIWMSSGSTNNVVRNCVIRGNAATTTLAGIGMGSATISGTSLGVDNDNNTIENNDIGACQRGVYSQGASAANKNNANAILLNKMDNAAPNNVGVFGVHTGFEDNLQISCNSISGNDGSSDRAAISAGFGTAFSTTTTVANEVTNATITNNVIGNVIGSSFNTYLGIALGAATSGTSTISNNMVYGVIGPSTSPDYTAGIVAGGGAGSTTNVLHNTVHMQGTMGTGSGAFSMVSACLALPNTAFGSMTVRNNIFSNVQLGNVGATGRFTAITTAASTFAGFTSSNNDLYAAGAGPGTYHVGITGGLTGTSQATLLDWQTATGQDAASVNVLPVFVSSTDLHLNTTNASNIANLMTGGTATSVTTDIDCASRSGSTPTIGAHEFSVPACSGMPSAGTSSPATTSVCGGATVAMSNNAVNSSTGITYQWQVGPTGGPYSDVTGGTGATTQSYTTGALTVGTYYYVLRIRCGNETIPNGDSYSNEVVVTVNPNPVITPSVTNGGLICGTGSVDLSATSDIGGTTFLWNPGALPGTPVTVSPTATTTYTVTGTAPSTCQGTAQITVTVAPAVTASTVASPTSVCFGTGATLTTTASPTSFSISNNSGTISVPVPDNSLTGATTTLPLSGGFGSIGASNTVRVTMSVTTTFNGDVDAYLVGPSNCGTLELTTDNGSSGDNYLNTVLLTPGGGANINTVPAATNNITGTWSPEGSLSTAPALNSGTGGGSYSLPATSLTGCPVNGTWTLFVGDDVTGDIPTITNFQLEVTGTLTGNYTMAVTSGTGTFSATTYSGTNNSVGDISVTDMPLGSNNYVVTTTAPSGCTTTSNVSVTVNACVYYSRATGNVSDPIWSVVPSGLPGAGPATFTSSTSMVVQSPDVVTNTSASVQVDDLTVDAGGTLVLNGSTTISVNGSSALINGTLTANDNSELELMGTAATSLTTAATTSFWDLTVNTAAGTTVTGNVEMRGTLQLDAGNFNCTGNPVVLRSTATETGRLGPVGATASYTGNMEIERFIPTGAADWRLLGSPIGNRTVNDWAADFITAGFPGSAWPNFDNPPGSNNLWPSIRWYDETNPGAGNNDGMLGATGITQALSVGQGFAAFIGDDFVNVSAFAINLRNGPPNIASTPISLPMNYTNTGNGAVDGWNLVSNPLPSAIAFDQINRGADVEDFVTFYNPVTGNTGVYDISLGFGTNGATNIIQSMQGFFLKATGAAVTTTVEEADKVNSNSGGIFGTNNNVPAHLRLQLTSAINPYSDETVLLFEAGEPSLDPEDALKFVWANDYSPQISSVLPGGELMAINAYGGLDAGFSIPVSVNAAITGEYTIALVESGNMPMTCLTLEDTELGTFTVMNDGATYTFTMDADDDPALARFILHATAPIAFSSSDALCGADPDGSATVTVSAGPADVIWMDDMGNAILTQTGVSGEATITGLGAGGYEVQVSTSSACGSLDQSFTIEAPFVLEAQGSVVDATCANTTDGSIDLLPLGGVFPYAFLWNDVNASTTEDLLDVASGDYTVTITDANDCVWTSPVITVGDAGPDASLNASATIVLINTAVQFSGADANASYFWDFGDGATSSDMSAEHAWTLPGTYTVTMTVTSGGCTETTTVVITVELNTIVIDGASTVANAWLAGDHIVVQHAFTGSGAVQIDLIDATGRLAMQRTVGAGTARVLLPAQELATGVWFVRMAQGEEAHTLRVPVIH